MAHDGTRRDYELPHKAPYQNEGKTVAGWVMFWGVCLGATVTALGLVLWQMVVLYAGIAVLAVAIIASIVLSAVGMGQPRDRRDAPGPGQPDWYA